ncbi:MAG: hypothetical protein RLZZ416_210 [Candidatus Parcubacteria bacterium]|jgi:hypothetical protein
MTAMERSWDTLTKGQKALDVVLIIVLASFFLVPLFSRAVDNEADMQCTPDKDYSYPFPQMNPKTKKQGGKDMPCTDVTNGNPTPGKCQAPMKCKGEPQKGGEPPKMPEPPKPPESKPSEPPKDQPCTPKTQQQASTTTISSATTSTSTSSSISLYDQANSSARESANADASNPCPSTATGSSSFGSYGNPYISTDLGSSVLNSMDKSSELNNAMKGTSGSSNSGGASSTGAKASTGILANAKASSLSGAQTERSGSSFSQTPSNYSNSPNTFVSEDLSFGAPTSGGLSGAASRIGAIVSSSATGFQEAVQSFIINARDWIAKAQQFLRFGF